MIPLGFALLVLGAWLAYGFNAGGRIYEIHDVPRYAQAVYEMRHLDSLVPMFGGTPYHDAAPLSVWCGYFSAGMIGDLTPLAMRLLPALSAILIVAVVFGVTRRISQPAAIAAGAFAVLNWLAWTYGRSSRVDATAAFAITAAIAAFYVAGEASGRRRWAWFAASGAATALGFAAKGPYSIAIIGAALGPWLLYERRWKDMLQGGLVVIAVSTALTLAWLLPYAGLLGPEGAQVFYDTFLMTETLEKYSTGFGKAKPPLLYLKEVVPKLAPMSLLAVVMVFRVFRRPGSATPLARLCVSWVIFPILVLSTSSGKHIRYVLPIVPAFAILAGMELDRWLAGPSGRVRSVLRWTSLVAGPPLALVGVAAPIWLLSTDGFSGHGVFAGAVVAAAGAGAFVVAWKGRAGAGLLGLFVAATGLIGFLYGAVLPMQRQAEQESDHYRLGAILQPHLEPDDAIYAAGAGGRDNRVIDASRLGLYLGNRLVSPVPEDGRTDDRLLFTREPAPGRKVRIEVEWPRGDEYDIERWYLLEPR